MSGNREYRSDVFCLLFRDKRRALELYNALNGSFYDDPGQVETVELGNGGISLSVRNDASFILDAHLNIYEHESTICPNMPLRCMIYFTTIVHGRFWNKNIYGRRLVKIAAPHFVVFYNGTEEAPAQYRLKLSDAFEHSTGEPEIELTCLVYNINKGKNPALIAQSPTLRDYMYFVDLVREYDAKTNHADLAGAIKLAIRQCITENVLKNFLKKHYTEVVKMMQWDFTFEHRLELEREEAREEGREEGKEDGRRQEANDIMEVARALRSGASNDDLKKKYRLSTIEHARELLQI